MTRPDVIPRTSPFQSSLQVSWKEGIAASIMIAVSDYYFIPLGLILGATVQEVGLLVAIPYLFGSISQLLAVRVVSLLGSRLRSLVKGVYLQASILFLVALLPLLTFSQRVECFIFLIAIFRIIGNLIGTVWGSLTSDYLAPDERGKYFGWRSQITGLAGVGALIFGGLFLYFFKAISPNVGFFLLMLGTAASRFVSGSLMTKMADVSLAHSEGADFTFFRFLARFRESNFVRFVLFVAGITFATHLAAPYFSVFMLRDLKFNYIAYMTVHLVSVLACLVAFPIWGRHADLVGNAKVLKVTSLLIPLIPSLWCFSQHMAWLIPVEIFSGFVWAGFNLCSANFIFDSVSPEKRVRCLSYFSFINGIALFLGAAIGGFLAERLPPIAGYRLLTLFLLSSFLRFCSHFFLSKGFREIRETAQKISSFDLFFSVVGIKPLLGLNRESGLLPIAQKTPWKGQS